jgi:hypothetical protein
VEWIHKKRYGGAQMVLITITKSGQVKTGLYSQDWNVTMETNALTTNATLTLKQGKDVGRQFCTHCRIYHLFLVILLY